MRFRGKPRANATHGAHGSCYDARRWELCPLFLNLTFLNRVRLRKKAKRTYICAMEDMYLYEPGFKHGWVKKWHKNGMPVFKTWPVSSLWNSRRQRILVRALHRLNETICRSPRTWIWDANDCLGLALPKPPPRWQTSIDHCRLMISNGRRRQMPRWTIELIPYGLSWPRRTGLVSIRNGVSASRRWSVRHGALSFMNYCTQ